jgi:hypothetical protein
MDRQRLACNPVIARTLQDTMKTREEQLLGFEKVRKVKINNKSRLILSIECP